MDLEPATVGKRHSVSSQTRSQAVGSSGVERDLARGSDRATPAAGGRQRPESGFAAQPTGVRRESRPQRAAAYFFTVTVICDGYCFEWCTRLRATTPFVSS